MCPCGLEHENKENQKMEDAFFIREAFDLSDINWPLPGKVKDISYWFSLGSKFTH